MKKDVHPEYGYVVFRDEAADFQFLTRSTAKSKKTIKWEDGKEYPLITLDISSASHPFYTGRQMLVDTAGRIEKFNRRYGKFKKGDKAPDSGAPAAETKPEGEPAEPAAE